MVAALAVMVVLLRRRDVAQIEAQAGSGKTVIVGAS
jgi:hypothetical protein